MSTNHFSPTPIPRHKAALRRNQLSRPVKKAIEAGIITRERSTIFDYGCGYGTDAEFLSNDGYSVIGRYDPYYFPDLPILSADVVLLSFVLSTIEDVAEREITLLKAYQLAQRYLIIGLLVGSKPKGAFTYNDGLLTKTWGTFEKFYTTSEAVSYLKAVVGVHPIRLDSGVYALEKLSPTVPSLTPLLAYSASDVELKRLLGNLRKQRYRLRKKGWIPNPKVYIEVYSPSNSDRLYYRLRSRIERMNYDKAPVNEILKVLRGKRKK